MERFSPLFNDTARLRYRRPEPSYRYVYPDAIDLQNAAYFFEYELADPLPDRAYDDLRTAVAGWTRAWQEGSPPTLRYWSAPGYLQIYDSRRKGEEGTYTFHGPLAEIYLACSDRARSAAALREHLQLAMPVEAIETALREFARRGLMFLDGSLALSLALPAIAGR
jgi:hypothetical protein